MVFAASQLCANLTALLSELRGLSRKEQRYDDSANSYKYIVFILIIYAVSFLSLMVKYFWSGKARRYDELYDQGPEENPPCRDYKNVRPQEFWSWLVCRTIYNAIMADLQLFLT